MPFSRANARIEGGAIISVIIGFHAIAQSR